MSLRPLQDTNGNIRNIQSNCVNLEGFDARAVLTGNRAVLLFTTANCAAGGTYVLVPPSNARVDLGTTWGGRVRSARLL
jgi:hypothetical protein